MSKNNPGISVKKRSIGMTNTMKDKVFNIIIYGIATIMILLTLYPMYFILIASISNPSDVAVGKVILFPSGFRLDGYKEVFAFSQLWVGYRNTIVYTILGTFVSLFVNIPAGFALSRKQLPGRSWIQFFYMVPMFIGGGLIPTYMILQKFNLIDNPLVMIVPFSVSTYYIVVARTFFNSSIPEELWDSAQIDGCGSLRYFMRIVLPLSTAILAVIGLWTAVAQWNSYFNALVYLRDENLVTLQLVVRNILINNKASLSAGGTAVAEAQQKADLIKYAVIVITAAPIMCLYPLVQKYFNQGVMLGAVKG